MILGIHTWWTHHDNLWRLSWCLAFFQEKNSYNLFQDFLLWLVRIDLDDATHELVFDSLEVHLEFSDSVVGELLHLSW